MGNNIELAYIAGVIDSDGCIGIRKSTYGIRRGEGHINTSYWGRISIGQMKPEAVNLCSTIFGGNVRLEKRKGSDLFKWDIQHARAIRVIDAVLPFLRIKKDQALTVLELMKAKKKKLGYHVTEHLDRWNNMRQFKHACYSSEQVEQFDNLYVKIRQMNDTRWDRVPIESPIGRNIQIHQRV